MEMVSGLLDLIFAKNLENTDFWGIFGYNLVIFWSFLGQNGPKNAKIAEKPPILFTSTEIPAYKQLL